MNNQSVNPQLVIQALGGRVAALAIENAMLQARISGLEAELQQINKSAPRDEKQPNGPDFGRGFDKI